MLAGNSSLPRLGFDRIESDPTAKCMRGENSCAGNRRATSRSQGSSPLSSRNISRAGGAGTNLPSIQEVSGAVKAGRQRSDPGLSSVKAAEVLFTHRQKSESLDKLRHAIKHKSSTECLVLILELSKSNNLSGLFKDEQENIKELCAEHSKSNVKDMLELFSGDDVRHRSRSRKSSSAKSDKSVAVSCSPSLLRNSSAVKDEDSEDIDKFKVSIEAILNQENGVHTLLYSYPFFSDEKTLISHLALLPNSYKTICTDLLKTIVLEGFPNGARNLLMAEKPLNALLDQLNLKMKIPALSSVCLKQVPSQESLNRKQLKFFAAEVEPWSVEWSNYTAQQLADAITERDIRLVQSISMQELVTWVRSEDKVSELIKVLSETFARTVNWMAFEIVAEGDDKRRKDIATKFIDVAHHLYKKRNYNGVNQVLLALCNPAVNRLLETQHLKCEVYRKLLALVNPTNSWSAYRRAIAVHCIQEQPFLPIFSVLYNQLYISYHSLLKATSEMFPLKEIQDISQLVKQFMNVRYFSSSCEEWMDGSNPLMNLVCTLPQVDESIISEYSALRQDWDMHNRPRRLPDDLMAWNCSHWVKFLKDQPNSVDNAIISKLFAKRVYRGCDVIAHIRNNPRKFIKRLGNIPESEKDRLLFLSAKHIAAVKNK